MSEKKIFALTAREKFLGCFYQWIGLIVGYVIGTTLGIAVFGKHHFFTFLLAFSIGGTLVFISIILLRWSVLEIVIENGEIEGPDPRIGRNRFPLKNIVSPLDLDLAQIKRARLIWGGITIRSSTDEVIKILPGYNNQRVQEILVTISRAKNTT